MSQVPFADRLNSLMAEQRVGVPTLSKRSGVPQRTISRYRAGTSTPVDPFGQPTPNAHALAKALGVDVRDLLDARPEALAS